MPRPDHEPRPAAAADVDRRIVSVLFADVVGFTSLSERLDSEDVATIQDAYFAATRETIVLYGGVVEKFIGDAAMAVFGAPRARDDDAERAVRAGLALVGAIEQIGARLGLEPGALELRVGVNTGEVVHATSGPDAGRVTGDTVNTAARLQTAARPGTVLVGELTALTVAETIETLALGAVELKGKAEPSRVWEAVGVRPQPSREEALGALEAPMLGRSRELAYLVAAREDVERERAAARCLVVAPPGVGKSRLLAEFGAVADGVVLRARVRPQGTAPYETVAQLLLAAAGDLPTSLADAGVPAGRATIIVSEVERLLRPGAATAGVGVGEDLAAEREFRFDAWVAALDALAPKASAWLIEDVHWAGGDLLAFLDHAGRATTRHGRLIVATARPSLFESSPAWSEGARLDLERLPGAEARELVHALVGAALPEDLVAVIADRADGTPLFIEELLRTWASVGTLTRDGDRWRLAVQPDDVPVPQTVQAIYAAQLDDLPPKARLVARRGAVSGRRVPLSAFGALELADQRDGLDVLLRRALLAEPVDDPITGETYSYRHALLRDAGYASLARAERARLHAALAGWLAEIAGERADAVAEAVGEHYALALASLPALVGPGLPDGATLAATAAAWYERAAEAAVRLSALDAARRLLSRSVELTGEQEQLDLARRRLRLGETLAASAELDIGIGELEAARAAFAASPEARSGYEAAAFALGRAYMQQIRFTEAAVVTRDGIDHLGDSVSDPHVARLHALHAWAVAANGGVDGVLGEVEAAWAAVRDGGDPSRELDVLEYRCLARDELDVAGREDWALLAERARRLQRWHQVVVAERVRAVDVSFEDPRAALGPLADVIELAATHGLTEQGGWGEYSRCETLWLLGDWDAALESGRRALDLAERYAYTRLAFRTFMVVLQIAAERGDAALAERWDGWWVGAQTDFPPSPSPYARVLRGASAVWLARAAGRDAPLPPADIADAIVPMVNPHFVGAVETVILAWIGAGRHDLATVAAGRWAATTSTTPPRLVQASAALIDAWLTGSRVPADRAVEIATRIPAPFWVSRARAAGSPG